MVVCLFNVLASKLLPVWGRCAGTTAHAAPLRQKLQRTPAVSPSHSIPTPSQPVPPHTL